MKEITVKAYWWKGMVNFGDGLSPFLLNHFANVTPQWSPVARAMVASIGSILEHIPQAWDGYILGAGKLKEGSHVHLSEAKVLALRGPLSAKGLHGNFTFGDPGILADELVGPQVKQWDLGIVPHWKDDELGPRFTKLIKAPSKTLVINPRADPLSVIEDIGACRRIVTSSLHGMIVADAFGIPRRVELSSKLQNATEGGTFKFRDYSASIKTAFVPGKMTEPSRWAVEDVKYAIYDAYKVLEKELHDL